ncbi:uncharacterized protein DUF4128 [Kushneria sinocarnis]|uniref:Uncharacterized protein DUF4128 n=1 Tax=Kushneria sinocarnis TaxID=595502 RepID=A0A420WUL2_9GAMM|nr:phage tail terminator-like protein [Kushneria sinocarnis]RKQ97149.1 uncharacterized protein DUF4128 [Kushneria sinocarnis]
MNDGEILSALEVRASQWPGDTPLLYDNQRTPADLQQQIEQKSTNWVRMTFLPGDTNPFETGTRVIDRRTGIVEFQIFTRLDSGPTDGYRIADVMGQHMAHQQLGQLETWEYQTERVGESNGWHQLNLQVRYRAQS